MTTNKGFSPHTRRQDETLITKQIAMGQGLVTKVDSIDGGFKELKNAEDYGTKIEGRRGSSLYNVADYQMSADETKTLEEALPPGVKSGDLITISNFGDFSDGSLVNAKGNFFDYKMFHEYPTYQMPFDVYQCLYEEIWYMKKYLGNIGLPYYKDFCPIKSPSPQTFTITLADNVITALSDCPDFTEDLVGKYIVLGMGGAYVLGNNYDYNGTRFLITEFVSTTIIKINKRDKTLVGTFAMCYVQAPIWASKEINDLLFIHIGNEVYYTDKTLCTWKKAIKLHDFEYAETHSKFDVVDNNLILSNLNGVFRFEEKNDIKQNKDTPTTICNSVFSYRINAGYQNNRIVNKTIKIWGFPDSEVQEDGINKFVPAGFSGDICDFDEDNPGENNSQTGGQIL